METMYYIGLDVHKKTISYCVKDCSGRIYAAGSIPATRLASDMWMLETISSAAISAFFMYSHIVFKSPFAFRPTSHRSGTL